MLVASVLLVIGRWHMPGQVHAVMQQPENFDDLPLGRPEDYEVPTLPAMPRNMQGANAPCNLVPRFGPHYLWAATQRLDCQGDRLSVELCLQGPKVLSSPPRNFKKIRLGLSSQSNAPSSPLTSVIASAVIDLRCNLKESALSKVLNRPASRSSIPTLTAERKASNREASSASRCSTRRRPLPQHFIGILVTTAADKLLDKGSLVIGKYNIAGRHGDLQLNRIGILCQPLCR